MHKTKWCLVVVAVVMAACSPGVHRQDGHDDVVVSSVNTVPEGVVYASFGGQPVPVGSDARMAAVKVHSPVSITYEVDTYTFPGNSHRCEHDRDDTPYLSQGESYQKRGRSCSFYAGDYKMVLNGLHCLYRNGNPCPMLDVAQATEEFTVRG